VSVACVVGRLTLAHPVLNGSGTLDALAASAVLGDATLGCAAHVTKTVTLHPRDGNPPPRLARASGGLLNSIGLQNPGLEAFTGTVLPRLAAVAGIPIVVSVGGFAPEDYEAVVAALDAEDAVAGLELNVSCPNVHSGCASIGADPAETSRVTARCRARTAKPLWVKLAPGPADLVAVARAAEAAGADALTLVNTARGAALDRRRRPALGARTGGLSGPPLRPQAVAAVLTVRDAVALDLIGLGGVVEADDARDLLAAGAVAVAVGTATFRDPGTVRRISAALAADAGGSRSGEGRAPVPSTVSS
jgi:dihydroorotate dehydrogenase (NAD+) catalytic subunit